MAVVGQRSEKVRRFIEDTGLPFDILVDDGRHVVKAYGVWQRIGIDAWNIAKPSLFLIDQGGMIRYVFVADWQTEFPEHGRIVEELSRIRRQETEDRRQKPKAGDGP